MEFVTTTPSGSWFKPAEHMNAKAFLIIPKSASDQADNFNPGQTRRIVAAEVVKFDTAAELDGNENPTDLGVVNFDKKALVSTLEPLIGKAYIGKLTTKQPRNPAFREFAIFTEVDKAVSDKVVAWATARDAAEKAAMADVPDFLK